MTELSRAPWTAEQVRSLNGYQGEARMHSFTCGRDHGPYQPVLEATPDGVRAVRDQLLAAFGLPPADEEEEVDD